ncbi:MAG: formate dehydrogenase accessory protein FdhE [Desulforhopalus sp.]|nr:formate dehydrogenase accessory protein FdhE [Desulforhopalus sp.]
MTIDIQAVIEKRPHLKEPLELYARWQRFHSEASALLPERKAGPADDTKAYPRAIAGQIFKLFASIFELPEEAFAQLGEAVENGEVDFMRLPLGELPTIASLTGNEEELAKVLYLFCRPFFQALHASFPLDGEEWQGGRCPLCSAQAAVATIIEGPARLLHCTFCGTSGPYRFIGCPNCGTIDTEKLSTIMSDDEPGYRVSTCDACHSYVKVFEHQTLTDIALDLADIVSLPLDIVAQSKGYARLAPNPISLKKMG